MGNRPLVSLVTAIAALVLLSSCQPREAQTNPAELTDFATRYAAAWSSQDPVTLASFYAENGSLRVNDGEPSTGREAIAGTARSFMTAFPDMVVRLVELRRDGDYVEFHWHWTGTNTGPGGTGSAVDLRGYERWTLDDEGLILESDGHYDEAEYQRQLSAPVASDTVATIGEGYSSSSPGENIRAGQRAFTLHTLQEACGVTPVPSRMVAEPIELVVGDRFSLDDPIVAAYDASGAFLPNVPIEIFDPDTRNARLRKELHTSAQDYLASEPGRKVVQFRTLCEGSSRVTADLAVTVRQPAD